MIRRVVPIAIVALVMLAGSAMAQRQRMQVQRTSRPTHMVEITPMGGYAWTIGRNISGIDRNGQPVNGDIDIKSGGYWGIAIDFNVRPEGQLELLYRRQDSKVTFRRSAGLEEELGDVAIEYWQIGGVGGVMQGNVLPYGKFTLGGTRYIFDQINDDVWKFSIILALGAKVYVNERIGLRFEAGLPFTFMSGGLGFGVGTGGASLAYYGSGLAQIDVSAGLMINI